MKLRDRIVVRFKSPSGAERRLLPSEALNQAMASLADTEEVRPLLCEASNEGKALAIDFVQDRSGRPIFLHFNKEEL